MSSCLIGYPFAVQRIPTLCQECCVDEGSEKDHGGSDAVQPGRASGVCLRLLFQTATLGYQ